MNLIDEEYQKNKNVNTKGIQKIIIAIIIIIVIMILAIGAYLLYEKVSDLRVTLDGQANIRFEQLLVFEEDGKVYMPIKEVSKYLGSTESYNGHYEDRSEDSNKCYIKSDNEAVNFTNGSAQIEVLNLTTGSGNYKIIETADKVKTINGALYASSDTISEAFNITFDYNTSTNTITVFTLTYLVESYTPWALEQGYSGISEKFENQKAIIDNRLVVLDINGSQLGVVDIQNNKIVLEPKYEDITYLSESKDYLIKTNGKMGIIDDNAKIIIPASYSSIEVLDYETELYIVSSNNNYGVIDSNGKTIIHTEYEKIGVNINEYDQPEIKNEYLLIDNIIPVEKEEKWALFDKTGKQLTEFKYDDIGYKVKSDRNAMSMLIIPSYNMLVVSENEKYGLVNSSGEEIIKTVADDIYMTIEGGERHYYISINDEARDAEEYLDRIGVKKVEENKEDEQTEQTELENPEQTQVIVN